MVENRYTCPRVVETIERIRIETTVQGQLFHPSAAMLEAFGLDATLLQQELFTVWINVKIGMDRNNTIFMVFENLALAEAFCDENPVGMQLPYNSYLHPIDFEEVFGNNFDSSVRNFAAGDDQNFLKMYECLSAAGVLDEATFSISKEVLRWAGQKRIDWAKGVDPENWNCIIQMEYCTYHFPKSSLAFMAAQALLNYYVLQDEYSAGYLAREIEVILGGAETVAQGVLSARKSAGRAGGDSSSSKKMMRLTAFLQEIEALSDLVGRIGEKAILNEAFSNAIAADPALWKQGRGQQEEYETILRSENGFMARYRAVFGKTA